MYAYILSCMFSSYNSCILSLLACSIHFLFLFLLPEAYTHLKCFDRVFETVYTLDENAAYIDDPSRHVFKFMAHFRPTVNYCQIISDENSSITAYIEQYLLRNSIIALVLMLYIFYT